MKTVPTVLVCIASLGASCVMAQDWPQWRGANRDAKAADFKAPKTWPKELIQKWKVTVGDGVATPALVGDKLYVFSRQDGSEVTRCLNAADGKELWQEKYESLGASGGAQAFPGPRSSPTVADGKVVTLGVRGMLSCLDAATGKKVWRKDDFKAWPTFHPASSPLIVNGLCVAQLGGRDNGSLVAYDLASGEQKWKWTGSSPAYASPVLFTAGGTKLIIAQTDARLIAVHATDGKLAWEAAAAPAAGPGGAGGPGAPGGPGGGGGGRGMGGGREHKAATPIVDGQNVIIAGRGIKALRFEKEGDKITARELWNNPDRSVQFNTPALKDGMLYGLTPNNELFCINARDGKLAWTAPFPNPIPTAGGTASLHLPFFAPSIAGLAQAEPAPQTPPDRRGGPGGPGGPGGRRGGGMGGGGYGSIVDAGNVLLALTPGSQLIVFEPGDKEFKPIATYKVAVSPTHAYPIASGNRIFIKDRDSLTLWTVE